MVQLCYSVNRHHSKVMTHIFRDSFSAKFRLVFDVTGVVQTSVNLPSEGLDPALAHGHVRASPRPQREPHDLSLGEDEEHDEGLDSDSDDDHNCNTTKLFMCRSRRVRLYITFWTHFSL